VFGRGKDDKAPAPHLKKEMADLQDDVVTILREFHRSVVEAVRVVLGGRPNATGDSRQILDATAEVRSDLVHRTQEPSWTEITKR